MSFSIEITGTKAVRVRLEGIPVKLEGAAYNRVLAVLRDTLDTAKSLCPVDTGSLRDSIRIESYAKEAGLILKTGIRAGGYIVNPKSGRLVDYAAYIEFGTSRARAQTFMRPALMQHQQDFEQAVKNAAAESVKP